MSMPRIAAASNEDLIARLRYEMPRLQRDYAVRSFGLFGSFARGEQDISSDVDLLVDFVKKPGMFGFLSLQEELSEILGRPVDLVTRDALKPAIGRRILSELKPV